MSKANLKTIAYNTIKKQIISCQYEPGSFLNEEALTSALNISRTPVRDALSRLEQEGLVEIRPKKGIYVKPVSMKDINMIFEIRLMYEPYIIRNYASMVPEERLEELYFTFSHADAGREALDSHDSFYKLDTQFHCLFINACPNVYLRQSYALIQTQNERFRHITGEESPERLNATFKEHCDILQACLQKDWKLAEKAMLFHLTESKKATFQLAFDNLMLGL